MEQGHSKTLVTNPSIMKTKSSPARPRWHLTEDEISDYAGHLYEQSGGIPGRDLDNWLEAEACLMANIPKKDSHRRLHRHTKHGEEQSFTVPVPEAKNLIA